MRKLMIMTLLVGMLAGAVAPSVAGKKPKKVTRTAESAYDAPALGSGAGICPGATNSCGQLPTTKGERFVTIEIVDAAGLPVYASVGQDLDGDTFTDESTIICGKTTEPISIKPGYDVTVFPWAIGRASCPGVATSGVVKATFTNL